MFTNTLKTLTGRLFAVAAAVLLAAPQQRLLPRSIHPSR